MRSKLTTLAIFTLLSWSVIAEDSAATYTTSYNIKDVLVTLEEALTYHDEIPTLEKSKLIGRDQKSALDDLDDELENLIEIFDSKELTDLQQQYRKLEERITTEKAKQQEYRKEMVLAVKDERSLTTKLLPGEKLKSMVAVSKADYKMLVEASEENLEEYQNEQKGNLNRIRMLLLAMQIDLTIEQIDVLMSSVLGDDIIEINVIFNAIKDIALKFEELTEKSGEDLMFSKKYYGMVVVLYRLMDKVQVAFVNNVEVNYLPKLHSFENEASENISASKKLMSDRVKVKTLKNNIKSNKETLDVILMYRHILEDQVDKVRKANILTKKEMAVANNTYRTVSLSSAVAGLISEGANNFSKLMSLQIPDVREFKNSEVRETFKILSAEINNNQ